MQGEEKKAVGEKMTLTLQGAHEKASKLIEAVPTKLSEYRCPLCDGIFTSFDDLQAHYEALHNEEIPPVIVKLSLNGRLCEVLVHQHWTLKRTLQFRLNLTGAKHMCDKGVCGSCTVIIDGKPVLSCQTLAIECEGKEIQTIEGIASDSKWKPLIDAYCRWDAMQCGYCTTGFLVTAKALLDRNPNPSEQECKEALAGNICICGTYPRHSTAILEAAAKMSGKA